MRGARPRQGSAAAGTPPTPPDPPADRAEVVTPRVPPRDARADPHGSRRVLRRSRADWWPPTPEHQACALASPPTARLHHLAESAEAWPALEGAVRRSHQETTFRRV